MAPEGQSAAYLDDAPKENPWTEDRLGFRPFSKRLAAAIAAMSAPNGYVIGLHGPWGSGKSTALNFVQAYLKKWSDEGSTPTPQVIEFRPWIISGHQDLISAYFKILTEELASNSERRMQAGKKLARGVRAGVDPLIDAAAKVSIAADPSGGMASKIAGAIAKKSITATLDKWLETPSLQSAYEDLKNRLAETGRKFLVIIDDIDRLDKAEIKDVMQMVKTVGRLPGVIYLLSYDRDVVWSSLEALQDRHRYSPGYAEKIVQQEIELPPASRISLLKMFDSELAFMNDNTEPSDRWYSIINYGISQWLRSPRDVARLANALRFSWPALSNEIDVHDLIAMDGLRLFDSNVFSWVRSNRDLVLGEGRFIAYQDEEAQILIDKLRNGLPLEDVSRINNLMRTLFPSLARHFDKEKNRSGFDEPYFAIVARRGVGSKAGFEAYFSLMLSENAISKVDIDAAFSPGTTLDRHFAVFESALSRVDDGGHSLIETYLEEIQYRITRRSGIDLPERLILSLFRFGQRIACIDTHHGSLGFPPRVRLGFVLKEIFERLGPQRSASLMDEQFHSQNIGLSFCCDLWAARARELRVLPPRSGERDPVIDEDKLFALREILIARIKEDAESGALTENPYYYDILAIWVSGGGKLEAQSWISEQVLISPAAIAKLSKGFLGVSIEKGKRHYIFSDVPKEDVYDLAEIERACADISEKSGISEDEFARIIAFREGLIRALHRDQEKEGG